MSPSCSRYCTNAAIVFFTICGIFAATLNATAQTKRTFPNSQSNRDSTRYIPESATDTIPEMKKENAVEQTPVDTSALNIPLYRHGSLFLTKGVFYKRMTNDDILWVD